jgi:hypothetical protein
MSTDELNNAAVGLPNLTAVLGVSGREPTGLRDMDGREIFTGDVVEFYFCADKGYSREPSANYTRMRDLVVKQDGDFYFVCEFGGSYAWRHNDFCRVIGDGPTLVDT